MRTIQGDVAIEARRYGAARLRITVKGTCELIGVELPADKLAPLSEAIQALIASAPASEAVASPEPAPAAVAKRAKAKRGAKA